MGAVLGDARAADAAAAVGYLDPDFFVYSDETDFCKRLATPGGGSCGFRRRGPSTTTSSPPTRARVRRTVEFHRNRDLYMRKHHSRPAALAVRALTAWFYAVRTVVAAVLRDDEKRWYWLHARQALRPGRGEGIRDAAEAYNRGG